MATFSLIHSLHSNNRHSSCSPFHQIKPTSRIIKATRHCRSHLPSGPSSGDEDERREESGGRKQGKRWRGVLVELWGEAEKLGRGLKESLSPKPKGDWTDLALMSLSFAVYVYISQRIVCAYCAWVSMLKHY